MKVKELKHLLESLPDKSEIVINSKDHEYRKARAEKRTALFSNNVIIEDYGEKITPESLYGKRQVVLLIS